MIRIIAPGEDMGSVHSLTHDLAGTETDLVLVSALRNDGAIAFDELRDDIFEDACIDELVECFSELAEVIPELHNGARIVFLIRSAFLGGVGRAPQGTKAASLIGLARSLALELAERNISVNCLALGENQGSDVLAEAIASLCSTDAADLTGQLILIDGGANLSLKKSTPQT